MSRANKNFYVGAFLAGSLGDWIICQIVRVLSMAYPQLRPMRRVLMLPANMFMILSVVVTFILIYKMWDAIQGRGARTSAGKALGFMFIPFFNFYWLFQVYWGWTKDYNRIRESEDVQLPAMPEGISLAVCVLPLVSMFLVIVRFIIVGWKRYTDGAEVDIGLQALMLVGLVNTILMALLINKICDGINALVDAGLAPVKPQYAVPVEGAKTSGRAIASLVLGICGIFTCGLSAIVGLILGITSLSAIRKSQGWLKGTGLAIAGIAVSATNLLMIPFMAGFMVTLSAGLRSRSMMAMSINNAKDICKAMIIYCDENDGSFPIVESWPDALDRYNPDERTITLPLDPNTSHAWAMNKNLDGRKIQHIEQPHRTVLIFEARPASPPAGGRELLPVRPPRGRGGYIFGFLDCHVECVNPERLDDLIWIPDTK